MRHLFPGFSTVEPVLSPTYFIQQHAFVVKAQCAKCIMQSTGVAQNRFYCTSFSTILNCILCHLNIVERTIYSIYILFVKKHIKSVYLKYHIL